MRLPVIVCALLAVAATQRGGCGTPPAPAADACAGLSCGDACTLEPACRSATPPCEAPSVAGRCDARGACVTTAPTCGASPCDGKTCGEPCGACGDVPCMTLVATACDLAGACVPATPWLCYDPCAGKACGTRCSFCPPDAIGCAAPACVSACDGTGRCICTGGGTACP